MLINDFILLICAQFSRLVKFTPFTNFTQINNLFFATPTNSCSKHIQNSLTPPTQNRRYKILCIKKIPEPITPEKATMAILEHVNLDEDRYRIGATKVLNHTVFVSMSSRVHCKISKRIPNCIRIVSYCFSPEFINFIHHFHASIIAFDLQL